MFIVPKKRGRYQDALFLRIKNPVRTNANPLTPASHPPPFPDFAFETVRVKLSTSLLVPALFEAVAVTVIRLVPRALADSRIPIPDRKSNV